MEAEQGINILQSAIYTPLDRSRRQIRILELHPGCDGDAITVSLQITSIPSPEPIINSFSAIEEYMNVGTSLNALIRQGMNDEIEFEDFESEAQRLLSRAIQVTAEQQRANTEDATSTSQDAAMSDAAMSMLTQSMSQLRSLSPGSTDLVSKKKVNLPTSRTESLNTTEYEAISYCWGSPKDTIPISVNGFQHPVPASAVEVLRRFRLQTKSRFLWLDALCINQCDDDEKAQQVSMMGHIYANAVETSIWLGAEDAASAESISFCRHVARQIKGGPDEYHYTTIQQLDLECERVSLSKSFDVSLLSAIFDRRWFGRLWVYQEVVLSRKSVCYIGELSIPWPDLELVVRWFISFRRHHPFAVDGVLQDLTIVHLKLPTMTLTTKVIPDFQGGVPLSSLAVYSAALQASEPRDKMFGLLSMTHWAKSGRALPSTLEPSYHKSLRDVMRDATRVMILEDKKLDAFRDVGFHAEEERAGNASWPSWVPVWSSPELRNMIPLDTRFDASGDWGVNVMQLESNRDPDLLLVDGFTMDTVEDLFPLMHWADFSNLQQVQTFVGRAISMLRGEDDEADISAAELLSILAEASGHDKPTFPENAKFKSLGKSRSIGERWAMLCKTEKDDNDDKSSATLAQAQEQDDIRQSIRRVCANRRFFKTLCGRVGVGPQNMQKGDVIVVLLGGAWPFILRETDDHQYRLIGQCFVHGMMEGEAVKECMDAGSGPETFELC